jgi:hypothetical protein
MERLCLGDYETVPGLTGCGGAPREKARGSPEALKLLPCCLESQRVMLGYFLIARSLAGHDKFTTASCAAAPGTTGSFSVFMGCGEQLSQAGILRARFSVAPFGWER